MNIFFLDYSPEQSAHWLCDKHAKMLLESAQLLATCFTLERLAQSDCPRTQKGTPRKHFNPNHPSALWTRKSSANMDWVILHALEIENERIARGMNPHFVMDFLWWVIENLDDSIVPEGELTEFAVAINEKMNCRKVAGFDSLDPTVKYKLYYRLDKPFASWTRNKPSWMNWPAEKIVEVYQN